MKAIVITALIVFGVMGSIYIWRTTEPSGGASGDQTSQKEQQPQYDRQAMVNIINHLAELDKSLSFDHRENWNAVIEDIGQTELTGCSPNFKSACREYYASYKGLLEYVSQNMPAGFGEQIFTGAINALTKGELDGGMSRFQEEVKRRQEIINGALSKMHAEVDG